MLPLVLLVFMYFSVSHDMFCSAQLENLKEPSASIYNSIEYRRQLDSIEYQSQLDSIILTRTAPSTEIQAVFSAQFIVDGCTNPIIQNNNIPIAQAFVVTEDKKSCCCISRDSFSTEHAKYPRVYACCNSNFTNHCARPIADYCLEPSAKADCLFNFTYTVVFPLVMCCRVKDSCCGDNK